MMSRRSFLEAAAWLAAAGSLAGCSSDGTAGVARGSAPGTVTADTPIYDVINNPLFDGYGRLLFPTTLHPPTEDMALDDLSACLPWYSEIHTSTTVDVVSYLLSERAAERTVFYDIYTDAEKAADPATYACVGDRDDIASWRTMQARLEALSATGVPTEFHVYEGLRHGFGLGIGTVAEGWIDDAIAFWEAQ